MFSFSRGYGGSSGGNSSQQPFNSGNNNSASRNTASQMLRKQQVATLFSENPTVRETKDGVYQIGLMLSDKKTIITLRIALGDGFPVSAPVLQIMTHATHPWLSSDGYCRVVGHPELINWNPHCNLGKIVKETVQEFCQRPPVLSEAPKQQQQPNTNNSNNSNNSNSSNHNNGTTNGNSHTLEGAQSPPKLSRKSSTFNVLDAAVIPPSYEKINNLNDITDMNILLEDENALKCFVRTLACVRNWDGVLNDQLKINAQKATQNLEYEDDLNVQAVDIFKLQTALKSETNIYKQHLKRQEQIQNQFKPSKIAEIVQNGCEDADEKSMEILNKFIDEEIELKPFLQSFVEMKKTYHRRKALLERFKATHGL